MLAKDVAPNRLERAKIELSGLIDRLSGDRVGIVVFAGSAFVQCPLTTDYAAAKMFLRAIDPAHMPVQGTDLASALDVSGTLLTAAEHGAKAKIIVLLTDGEDTSTEDVSSSVKELSSQGIKVFPLGIGSSTGEPIPLLDSKGNFSGWKKDRQGNTVMTRLDEKGLSEIANATKGHYIHSTAGSIGVDAVAQELNKLDKSEIESRITVKYAERFQYFIVPGLLLLLWGAFLKHSRGRA
jgi:Ca-activated chloride channel family protein